MKTVYFDLDGVMANCEASIVEKLGKKRFSTKEFWKVANQPDFFLNLEPFPNSRELIDAVKSMGVNVRVLTATGHRYSEVMPQKVLWVTKHLGIKKQDIIVVISGLDKAAYADVDSILVDDTKAVIEAWEAEGGKGILHTDHYFTIQILESLLD